MPLDKQEKNARREYNRLQGQHTKADNARQELVKQIADLNEQLNEKIKEVDTIRTNMVVAKNKLDEVSEKIKTSSSTNGHQDKPK